MLPSSSSADGNVSFFFMAEQSYVVCVLTCMSSSPARLLADAWAAPGSWLLSVALLRTLGCVCLFELVFSFSLGLCPGVGLGHLVVFSFLRNRRTALGGCPGWHPLQCAGPVPSRPRRCLLLVAVLAGVRQCLVVLLICVPLTVGGVECLFTGLPAVCVSSLEEYLFGSSTHFLNQLL